MAKSIFNMLRILSLSFLLCTLVANASQPRKVLIIGIDGVRSDALLLADMPNVDALIANGLSTFDSYNLGTTVSGPSWSAIMTGVWQAKHGVTDNSYSNAEWNTYPYFPTRAKEYLPDLYCVQVTEWAPMSDQVDNDGWDVKIKVPDGLGAPTAQAAVTQLANPDLDAMFVYFDQVDLAGHANAFDPNNSVYMTALENVDPYIGQILTALYARPDYDNENWLILLITDHGGIGSGHGGGQEVSRHIWWIASGKAVEKKVITSPDPGSYVYSGAPYFVPLVNDTILANCPVQTDIAVTALHHLLYDEGIADTTFIPQWDLDGKSLLAKFQEPVGVKETVRQQFDVKVFPNPTSGITTIYFENPYNQKVNLEVYDMSGKQVSAGIEHNSLNKINVDLSQQAKGTYIAQLMIGSVKITSKIILD